jgi:hypothetical protein
VKINKTELQQQSDKTVVTDDDFKCQKNSILRFLVLGVWSSDIHTHLSEFRTPNQIM